MTASPNSDGLVSLEKFDHSDRENLQSLIAGLPAHSEGSYTIATPDGAQHTLPRPLLEILTKAAQFLKQGNAVTLVPVGKELTTRQAADILNVSRQYLVRLVEDGKLPFTKTGTHRRLKLADVLAYKAERDLQRGKDLDELVALTQEAGGYPELE